MVPQPFITTVMVAAPEGCFPAWGAVLEKFGQKWCGCLPEPNWENQNSSFPALEVPYDICWAAVMIWKQLCFGERTSLSTGTRQLSLWKAQLEDVMQFGS